MGWRPYQEMDALERKMYWAVREETMLHQLPAEERNHLRDGIELIPAQDPAECSRVLLDWFDQGLATVMVTRTQVELTPERARALLSDPSAWTLEHSLVLTDAGVSALTD
jgi:hypothetical protein